MWDTQDCVRYKHSNGEKEGTQRQRTKGEPFKGLNQREEKDYSKAF